MTAWSRIRGLSSARVPCRSRSSQPAPNGKRNSFRKCEPRRGRQGIRHERNLRTMNETRLVEVYRAMGELEAQVIRSKLEASGIRAIFQNEALGTLGFTLDGLGEFRILVASEDEQDAREILETE